MDEKQAFNDWMSKAEKYGFLSDEAQSAWHVWKKISSEEIRTPLVDLPF